MRQLGVVGACGAPLASQLRDSPQDARHQVSAGSRHVLALDDRGRVYSWGWGQVRAWGAWLMPLAPALVHSTVVSHGFRSRLWRSVGNWGWARCASWRCPLEWKPTSAATLSLTSPPVGATRHFCPRLVRTQLEVCVAIVPCRSLRRHAGLLSAGAILVFGDNGYGQLGLGEAAWGRSAYYPTRVSLDAVVSADDRVRGISCGGCHTAAVTGARALRARASVLPPPLLTRNVVPQTRARCSLGAVASAASLGLARRGCFA